MTQKIICRFVWTRKGMHNFQREVNACLMEGWIVRDVSVAPGWVRTLCMCLLESPEDD